MKNSEATTKEMLQLSPWDFDQSPDGWRKFEETEDYLKAAKLIQEYISKNEDRILDQTGDKKISIEVIYFHIGQLLALAGRKHWKKAIETFHQTLQEDEECWNAYVMATIGFLEGNENKIDDAIQIIEVSKEKDKKGGNLDIVKNFKKALRSNEHDYGKIYSMPRSN